MKKIRFIFLVLLAISLLATGCDNSSIQQETKEMQDNNFIKDLERSTKARWKITDKKAAEEKEQGETFDIEKDYEYMKKYVKAESDILYKYENAEFKDAKLRKLAFDYIEGIKNQEKALEYYYSDEEKFSQFWEEGYDKRSVSLLKLNEEYGVKLDEKNFETLRQNAQVVKENKEVSNKIDEMSKTIKFIPEEDGSDWKTYSAVVENTTGVAFDYFELEIKLIDSDGVIIESPYAYIQNWNPGEKARFEFSTNKEFDKIEWDWGYYN